MEWRKRDYRQYKNRIYTKIEKDEGDMEEK